MSRQVIAIIDDDEALRSLMEEALGDEGYATITWSGGAGALAFLREQRPAALMLDLRLSDADDGLSILAALRADPDLVALPVVFCSADHRIIDERRVFLADLGAIAVPKPFDLDELLSILRSVLSASPADPKP